MVHTLENTSWDQLFRMDLMQRWVALNHLICDMLWAFTVSRIPMVEMSAKEFHAYTTIMALVEPDVLDGLPLISVAERRSALNEKLDQQDRKTLQLLAEMVLARLPRDSQASGQSDSYIEEVQGEEKAPTSRPPANNNLSTTPLPFRKYVNEDPDTFLYNPPTFFAATRVKAKSAGAKKSPPAPIDTKRADTHRMRKTNRLVPVLHHQ